MSVRRTPPVLFDVLLPTLAANTKPLAVILAGHNGSGKTTLWTRQLSEPLQIPLINADRLIESVLPPRMATVAGFPYWAQRLRDTNTAWQHVAQVGAQAFIKAAMSSGLAFAFETVFSAWQSRPLRLSRPRL